MDFEYNANPGRVIFGRGALKKLPAELERLKFSKPLILSTPEQVGQANDVKEILGGKVAGIFSEATMHTPTNVSDKAVEYAKAQGADCVVGIGGGSTTGLGKVVSFRTGLYHISIPTTYAGSEMTPIVGETADGVKKTRSDPKLLPGTVIYDVDLTMTLPVSMSTVSGVNAIAHAGEALVPVGGCVRRLTDHDALISGGSVRQKHKPDHQPDGNRRHQGTGHCPAADRGRPVQLQGPVVRALRRMAMWDMSGQRGHEHSPQAVPHPGR